MASIIWFNRTFVSSTFLQPTGSLGMFVGAHMANGANLFYIGPYPSPGPITWSVVSGSLPPGLTLSPSALTNTGGLISGICTTAGTFTATIQATAGAETPQATLKFIVTATKDPAVIIGFSQAGWNGNFVAVAGQPLYYPLEFKLNSSGGAALSGVTWTAIDPIPASLSLTSTPPDQTVMFGASGAIFGTPSASGNFSFRIQATDGTHTETTMVNLAISADQNYQMSLPLANIGTPFSFALDRSWGDTLFAAFGKVPSGPYTFADPSHTLPAGLSISSAGLISGTPTTFGTVQPSLHVTGGAITEIDGSSMAVFQVLPATGQPFGGTFVGFFGPGNIGGGNL